MLSVLVRLVRFVFKLLLFLTFLGMGVSLVGKGVKYYQTRNLRKYTVELNCKKCVARDTQLKVAFNFQRDVQLDSVTLEFQYQANPKAVVMLSCAPMSPYKLVKVSDRNYRCDIKTDQLLKGGAYEVHVTLQQDDLTVRDEAKATLNLEDSDIPPAMLEGKKIYTFGDRLPFPFEGVYVKGVEVKPHAQVFVCSTDCPECIEDMRNKCEQREVAFVDYDVVYIYYGLRLTKSQAKQFGFDCAKVVEGYCELDNLSYEDVQKLRKYSKGSDPLEVLSGVVSLSFGIFANTSYGLVLIDDWDQTYPMLVTYGGDVSKNFVLREEDLPNDGEVYRFGGEMVWQFPIQKGYKPAYLGAQKVSKGLFFFLIPYKDVDLLWGVKLTDVD